MAIDSVKNLFAIADLRKRVLFTLALLIVYRIGGHIPTPGVNTAALAQMAEAARNTMFGLYDMFSGKNLSQMTIFALGHHAVHQRVDHSAAADRGLALPRADLEGRRARPPQDYAVHALRHDSAGHRAVARHRHLARAHDTDDRRACRSSTTRAGPSGS
jgi:preprotein translocase subunit SecY